jgi:carbamoyltransferase
VKAAVSLSGAISIDRGVRPPAQAALDAGFGGDTRHGCVALCDGTRVLGVCEQERVTRIRGAGFNPSTGLPDEALDLLLDRLGHTRADIGRYVRAEPAAHDAFDQVIDHHLAHASTAFLTSPFSSAAILVCDHEAPYVTLWHGRDRTIEPIEFRWRGPGFSELYSQASRALGFGPHAGDQRMEALARLAPRARDEALERDLRLDGDGFATSAAWQRVLDELGAGSVASLATRAARASAVQTRLSELLLELVGQVMALTGKTELCLAGSLFYHSAINTAVKLSVPSASVFVPVDPGNPGLAVGTAMHGARLAPRTVSPYLGPAYSSDEIKQTLDNCKVAYEWEDEGAIIGRVVEALGRGQMVGWFDGAMEWGPRALGSRSILANPFAPFVLENLNRFLKRREAWRGYALSGLSETVARDFEGPATAPFMECDYLPRDRARYAHVLPSPDAAVRVQTVDSAAPDRFRLLVQAFGEASGSAVIVNTSFNGFHEPIVCNPRDAVRVFYGTGLDMLVVGPFVLTK